MKKGALPLSTLGAIILILVAGIIIILIVLSLSGYLGASFSGLVCGINVGIRGSTPIFKDMIPLMLCKQYQTPVKIDGTKFEKCPGLNRKLCDHAKGNDKRLCQIQCAQIQIDALTDACWKMGGKGLYSISGWFPGKIVGEFFMGQACPVLRCYRFQVVNPDVEIFDYSFGNGSKVVLSTGETLQAPGISAVHNNEIPTAHVLINVTGQPDNVRELVSRTSEPTDDPNIFIFSTLNYGTDKKKDICYIAYYYCDPQTVMRSCKSWSEYISKYRLLN